MARVVVVIVDVDVVVLVVVDEVTKGGSVVGTIVVGTVVEEVVPKVDSALDPKIEPEPEPEPGAVVWPVSGSGDFVVTVVGSAQISTKSWQQSFDFLHNLSQKQAVTAVPGCTLLNPQLFAHDNDTSIPSTSVVVDVRVVCVVVVAVVMSVVVVNVVRVVVVVVLVVCVCQHLISLPKLSVYVVIPSTLPISAMSSSHRTIFITRTPSTSVRAKLLWTLIELDGAVKAIS